MMERIKAKQEGRTVGEGEDLKAAREQAEAERDEALKKVASLEREVQRANETARQEAFDELRVKYDQKAEQAERVKSQLQQEIRSLTEQLEGAKESTASRLRQMERSITDAEEAARAEAASSVRSELEARLDESDRMRSRLERRQQEAEEEWAAERSRFEKQIQNLESNLEQAREMAFKRSSDPTVDELNRLRRQLEEEFRLKTAAWEEEKVRLTEKISQLEHPPS
jgi:chromosome segregation ATPase